MPFRAADIHITEDVSTYPRAIDFPMYCEGPLPHINMDIINVTEELICCRDNIGYRVLHPITGSLMIVVSRNATFILPDGDVTVTVISYYDMAFKGGDIIFAEVEYVHPTPPIGVIEFEGEHIKVGGAPIIINTTANLIVEDRSRLSGLFHIDKADYMEEQMPDLDPLPGWTQEVITVDDIGNVMHANNELDTVLADWIMSRDVVTVNSTFYYEIKVNDRAEIVSVYKVTNDETGPNPRGYVNIVYK